MSNSECGLKDKIRKIYFNSFSKPSVAQIVVNPTAQAEAVDQ